MFWTTLHMGSSRRSLRINPVPIHSQAVRAVRGCRERRTPMFPRVAVHGGDEERQDPPSVHPSSSSQKLPRKKDGSVPNDAILGENEEPQDQPRPHPPSDSQRLPRKKDSNVPDDGAQGMTSSRRSRETTKERKVEVDPLPNINQEATA